MITLDTEEQEKMDEELKERFKKYFDNFNISKESRDKSMGHFLFKLCWTLLSASPEDFQLLKHAAKDIADRHNL